MRLILCSPLQSRIAREAFLSMGALCLSVGAGCGRGSLSIAGPPPTWPGSTPSSTSISASPLNLNVGTSVALSASVAPKAATGTVNFLDGTGNVVGSAQLSEGSANLQAPTSGTANNVIGPGTHFLSAQYKGDFTYAPSTSSSVEAQVSVPDANCGLGMAVKLFSGTNTESGGSYSASDENQSAVCAATGASVTLNQPTIESSGNATSYDDRNGLGAAVLAYSPAAAPYTGDAITINNGTIAATGVGVPALFASGPGAILAVSDSTVSTTGGPAISVGGASIAAGSTIAAARGGAVTLLRTTASSTRNNSALLAIDGGGGSITVNGGSLNADDSNGVMIRGSGTISLSGAALTAALGFVADQDVYDRSSTQTATISLESGSYTYTSDVPPLFDVGPGETATITLHQVVILPATSFAITANFLQVSGNQANPNDSATGIANLIASDETFAGRIQLIEGSSRANISLEGGSHWKGYVYYNGIGIGVFNLTLDASSVWDVTADCAITSLTDAAGISGTSITNINGNGHTVTYVSAQNPPLGGRTYSLANGGVLKPAT